MSEYRVDLNNKLGLLINLPQPMVGTIRRPTANGSWLIEPHVRDLPTRLGDPASMFLARREALQTPMEPDAVVAFEWDTPGHRDPNRLPVAVNVRKIDESEARQLETRLRLHLVQCFTALYTDLDGYAARKAREMDESLTSREIALQPAEEQLKAAKETVAAREAEWERQNAELSKREARVRRYEAIVPPSYLSESEPQPTREQPVPMPKNLAKKFPDMLQAMGAGSDRKTAVAFLLSTLTAAYRGSIVLLEGPVGVGKSKTVEAAAHVLSGKATMVPVRPAWLDPSDLLGFYDPLKETFRPTPFLTALLQEQPGLHLLCLDELNLAKIENYGADLLSRLEYSRAYHTSHAAGAHEERLQLYSEHIWAELEEEVEDLRGRTELGTEQDRRLARLRRLLATYPGLARIPENVVLLGTLNSDATTYDLSPKVIDRSFVIPYPALEELTSASGGKEVTVRLTFSEITAAVQATKVKGDGYIANLSRWNGKSLGRFGIPLGHRAVKDWKVFAAIGDWAGLTLKESFAHFVAVKILPRISFFREDQSVTEFREWLDELRTFMGDAAPEAVIKWLKYQCDTKSRRSIRYWRDKA